MIGPLRGVALLGGLVAVVAGLFGRRAGWSSAAPPAAPPAPSQLPLDPWGTRADLATDGACVGREAPGVAAFRAWVLSKRGGRDGGILRACETGGRSEHHEGRAWDWMIGLDGGRALVDELVANEGELARRAGILYLIHDRRRPGDSRPQPMMWRAYEPRGWSVYTGPNPHSDHVHASFTRAGAAGRTTFYTHGEGRAFLPGVA